MQKTILITGSTDGIGLETARMLVSEGHHVLLHGRNPAKLEEVEKTLSALTGGGDIESYVADLSRMADVEALANEVVKQHGKLDILINNAGVYITPETITPDGLDVRFAVNTLAPCLLTQRLLPLLESSGRVISLSSAAQTPVDTEALTGRVRLPDDYEAYAQSKLAITMWSRHMALAFKENGPVFIAVNPGSLLVRHWQMNSQRLPASILTTIQVSLPHPIRMRSIHRSPQQLCTLSRQFWLKSIKVTELVIIPPATFILRRDKRTHRANPNSEPVR